MLLYHTLRQLSTEDADCCRFALPHRRPSGLIFLRHRFAPPFPGGLSFPGGEGGQKSKLKAGQAGDKQGKPPPGAWFAPFPSAARVQPRGCKGRSPLHEITLIPLPRRGRGWGDRGQKGKQKAGSAGDKEGTPPAGHRNRKNPPPHETTAASAKKSTILLTDTVICAILFQQFQLFLHFRRAVNT